MKNIKDYIRILMVSFLILSRIVANAQTPTFSCIAMNDTLISSTVYQFDVYIYQTGSTPLYLNNYQLSFQASNTVGILNGGALTGSYVSGSTQLPAALTPAGVSTFLISGNYEFRVNGVAPNSNGTLIPVSGTRVGTFRITNTAAFAASTMSLVWWNTTPATTLVYAIVPPAPTGTAVLLTVGNTFTTNLTNPILNAPVTAFTVTGSGSYCGSGPGLPVGLDGSQTGVSYQLILSTVPTGPIVPGTGSPISFGNQTAGTYTATGYRKATYLTTAMNGNAVINSLPPLPVSVSILASANPVCAATPITFTATPTNGGITPSYQWQVNGVNAGTNSNSFTYTPVNNDQVKVILTSSETCATGNPATSNTITETVNPNLPVSVSILASANPVCAATPITFTATPTNGGITPSYQWQVNGVNAGSNSNSFTYTPVNNDLVKVILTSSETCATGNPATSNTITETVNPNLPVSVSILASANPVCAATPVTFTATPTNGGITPSYQWQVNGVNAGTNNVSFTYTPVNNDQVKVILTSSETCATGNPATSNTITETVNPNLPVSVSILASANPVCAATPVTFTATPTNGGVTPSYQWQVNGVNAGTNSNSFTYTPVNNDLVKVILTSSETCATGNPATSNTITETVNPNLPVSVSILASANPVCAATPVTFTATPTNGGITPSYQWQVNGVNAGTNNVSFTYTPVNNDQVKVILTSSETCATGNPATSNTITETVNPTLPVSVSILASANPVCAATSTATPTNGGITPSYQWQVNGVNAGTNSNSFTYTPVNNDQVKVILTSSETCATGNPATSNTITETVNPNLPVSVSILASANPVCAATPVTFTATPTNGGITPSYQWQVNGVNAGTNSNSFTYTPVNNDQVKVILTSSEICATGNPATSNTITETVNPNLPVSVSILASSNPVCAATPVTFTATPTNGGITPSYQWQVNGVNAGTNNVSFTYTPVNNDQVKVILTSNATCATGSPATSNIIIETVNSTLPVSVSILASSNPVCAATPITFTATPTNGGITPSYQWQVNGVNAGTNNVSFTYTPVNNDQVKVILTSSETCATGNPATSNTITETVNPNLPVSVSILASANPVCAAIPVTFTATPTNGGVTPSYQWQVNGVNAGTNSNSFTYTPVNNDQVKVILTSSETCATDNPATSNTITETVNPNLPVSVSILASANPVCAATPVTFTATPTNGGITPSYQWQVNGVNAGTNSNSFTYTPVNNDQVKVILTSSETCATGNPATSNTITETVNPNLPVSVSILASANPVCAATPVTFTATPINGGITPSYQWQVNGVNAGTNSNSFTYTPVNNDQVKVVLTSSETCATGNPATSNIIIETVNSTLPVSVSILASSNPVCAATPVTFTATPTNGGITPSYQWQVNGVNAGTNSASFTYTPFNNDQVKVILTSSITCATGNPATSNTVVETVNSSLPVSVSIVASANPLCTATPVTFTATPTNGGLAPSYQWQVNGVNSGTNSPTFTYTPVNNDQVKVILTSGISCATGNPATSNTITETVNPNLPVSVSILASANPVCAATPVTFTATPINGGITPSYQWQVNGVNAGTNSNSFTYPPVNNDQVKVDSDFK
jgi:hypothetical protein